jgi:serine/threonine-protein kinase
MEPFVEDEVLRLALERGHLRAADLESLEAERGTRLRRAVEAGLLDADTTRELTREAREALGVADSDAATKEIGEDRPRSRHDPTPGPFRNWTRYRYVDTIGAGGMGRVYKAFDPVLERVVALKFLREDDPHQIERFHREALAQARVKHEYVCPVHEVGEVEGAPYIAMDFIEGGSLAEVARELTLEQKVRLVKQAAEALHEAHRVGLIHRDVKPGNIMVTTTEDGELRPSVVDFGLARRHDEVGVTLTGEIVGTAAYMSPEQVQAGRREVDRRTDVYGLGATLYTLVTRRPVFEGTLREILQQVVREVPRAPRDLVPAIPRDVEAIAMKCLRKDPGERYESARALAEDLGRFLDGEPVEARDTGFWYRLRMKAAKYKVEVATAAVGLVLLGAALGWGIHTMWRSAEIAGIAQAFGQQVERIEAVARRAALTPLHDTRPEREQIRKTMDDIRNRMRELGDLASGPGHYALGRGELLLESYDDAYGDLEVAWEEGYDGPETAYAIGLALGQLYRKALREVDFIQESDRRERERVRIESEYRDAAARYLRQGVGPEAASAAYVEALLAYCESRYDDALEGARTAHAGAPWLYEAKQLEAQVFVDQAVASAERGDFEAADTLFASAASSLDEAIAVGTSDPDLHLDRASLYWRRMLAEITDRGNDVEPFFREGIRSVENSLVALPGNPDALDRLAALHRRMGEYLVTRGEDPGTHFEAAVAAAESSLAIRPDQPAALNEIGTSLRQIAKFDRSHGRDPSASLARALEAYETARELDPTSIGHGRMGLLLKSYAEWMASEGEDPTDMLARSIAEFEAGLGLDPERISLLHNLGLTWSHLARHEAGAGEDPLPSYAKAVDSFERALEVNPNQTVVLYGLGNVHKDIAEHVQSRGQDPGPEVRAALEVLDRAIELNPQSAYVAHFRDGRGVAYLILAEHELEYGDDPTATLEKAFAEFESALAINPNHYWSHNNCADGALLQAEFLLETGEDPGPAVSQAIASSRTAIAMNPGMAAAHTNLGRASLIAATHASKHGADPGEEIAAARAALAEARRLAPGDASPAIRLAKVEILDARWRSRRGGDPSEPFARAERLLDAVLEDEPLNMRARLAMAELRLAEVATSDGEESREWIEDGLRWATTYLDRCPGSAQAMAVRGCLTSRLARGLASKEKAAALRDAQRDLGHAIARNHHLEREYGSELADVTKRVNETGM